MGIDSERISDVPKWRTSRLTALPDAGPCELVGIGLNKRLPSRSLDRQSLRLAGPSLAWAPPDIWAQGQFTVDRVEQRLVGSARDILGLVHRSQFGVIP
jgi:hypothetical protein